MIERAFTMQTAQFEATTPEADFANPRCFGRDFAQWLKGRLSAGGLETSEPIQEDWGWALLVRFQGHRFTLSIGVMDDSVGRTPAEWRVGVAYERGLNGVSAFVRRPPETELSALASVLEGALRSNSRFENVSPA